MSEKLTQFKGESITFVETTNVKDGVICDVYAYNDTQDKDFAHITVAAGSCTPKQRVLAGEKTIEGYSSGVGKLIVTKSDGSELVYTYTESQSMDPVVVQIGDQMQWCADFDQSLVFYEICYPPYKDGRFENLTE